MGKTKVISYDKFILLICIFTFIVAISVILAWYLARFGAIHVSSDIVTMKYNTALLFCLSSIILHLQSKKKLQYNTVLSNIAIISLCIFSFSTLLQYVIDYNLGIDEFLITDTISTNLPGRMSPATSLCFMLLGVGFIGKTTSKSWFKKRSHYLFLIVIVISFVSIISFILQIPTDHKSSLFNSMSLLTSILFLLLSVAANLNDSENGIINFFIVDKRLGSKLARKLIPWFIIVPLVLSVFLIFALDRNFMSSDFGIVVYTIFLMTFFIILFIKVSQNLNNSESKRIRLNTMLIESNKELVQFKYALDQMAKVVIFNEKGYIVYANERYLKFFKYSKEELLNSNQSIFDKNFFACVKELPSKKTFKNNAIWTSEISKFAKDKTLHWLNAAIVPYHDNSDKETYLGIFIDITKKKEAEKLLTSEYVQKLEEKNKELEQFSYIASHDLQEPIGTISASFDILQKEYGNDLEEEAQQLLKFIGTASSRASLLIRGLMDYSRIGQNLKLKKVGIKKILKENLNEISDLIKKTEAEICFGNLPKISGYENELKFLFQNLIQNAIKFRREKVPPKIKIDCQWNSDSWLFSVTDNGIGISENHLEKIFTIFQKLHTLDEYEGLGIGLAHCAKIVSLHKGEIWAESVSKQSTTIFFTLKDLHNE